MAVMYTPEIPVVLPVHHQELVSSSRLYLTLSSPTFPHVTKLRCWGLVLLRSFDLQKLQMLEIWLLVELATDIQQSLCNVDPERKSELGRASQDHGTNYRKGSILVISVLSFEEPLRAKDIIHTERGLQTLLENFHVCIVGARHGLNVLAVWTEANCPAVGWAKGQTWVSYMYENDDAMLSPYETLIPVTTEILFLPFSTASQGSWARFSASLTTNRRWSRGIA